MEKLGRPPHLYPELQLAANCSDSVLTPLCANWTFKPPPRRPVFSLSLVNLSVTFGNLRVEQ
jgi:hypothetical protein